MMKQRRRMLMQMALRKGKAYFGGAGYLTLANSADWAFGNGDFCVEWIEYRSNVPVVNSAILTKAGSGGIDNSMYYGYYSGPNPDLLLFLSANGLTWDIASAVLIGTYDLHKPNHFAITRNGNTFRTFKNGVQVSTFVSALSIYSSSQLLTIGAEASKTYFFEGGLNGIRITKGTARYTANFTPPADFINDTNTVLCLRFAEKIGATTFVDDTGKTVTTYGNVVIIP